MMMNSRRDRASEDGAFVTVNRIRIATRRAGKWVSIEPGWSVFMTPDLNEIVIEYRPPDGMPDYQVNLRAQKDEATAIRDLRQALKVLLRRFDLKAVSIEQVSN